MKLNTVLAQMDTAATIKSKGHIVIEGVYRDRWDTSIDRL